MVRIKGSKNKKPMQMRQPRIVDPVFGEVLFKLWMSGKTIEELYSLFKKDNPKLTRQSIIIAMERYGWKERREAIMKKVNEDTDNQIIQQRRKFLNAVFMILDMNLHDIENTYIQFIQNPDNVNLFKDKYWMVGNLNDLKDLINYCKQLGDKPNENNIDESNGIGESGMNIFIQAQAQNRDQIIKLMKNNADSRHLESTQEQISKQLQLEDGNKSKTNS